MAHLAAATAVAAAVVAAAAAVTAAAAAATPFVVAGSLSIGYLLVQGCHRLCAPNGPQRTHGASAFSTTAQNVSNKHAYTQTNVYGLA